MRFSGSNATMMIMPKVRCCSGSATLKQLALRVMCSEMVSVRVSSSKVKKNVGFSALFEFAHEQQESSKKRASARLDQQPPNSRALSKQLFLLLKAAQEAVRVPWSAATSPHTVPSKEERSTSDVTAEKRGISLRDSRSIEVMAQSHRLLSWPLQHIAKKILLKEPTQD